MPSYSLLRLHAEAEIRLLPGAMAECESIFKAHSVAVATSVSGSQPVLHGIMLYEAAQSMLFHSTRWSWLKAWAMQIA